MARDRAAGWAYVRAAGAVFEADDGWYLTSAEAVQYAQRHPEVFSSARAFDSLGSPLPLIPIAMDPPQHVRYRRVLDPMLAPRVINAMEDELRRHLVVLVDALVERGSCDAIADLARLYPSQVFLTLFGLPLDDRDQFIEWAEFIIEHSTGGSEPDEKVLETAGALFGYLQQFIEAKRQTPGDDMLSRILSLTGDDAWTDEEILGLAFLFTLAGLDTVTAEIGFLLFHLATDRGLRRRVVGEPPLNAPLIEEIVRLEPPAPIQPRVTTTAVEVAGVTIPAGAPVNLVVAAANRDPGRFVNPDVIDLDASDRAHFGFGGGIHRCLGSHLARRELSLVLEEFHRRVPDYELAPGADPAVVWPSGTLHLVDLPLVFSSA
ncbi:MAG: cytochrome P450 [Acidimicrobiales bacterium]